VRRREGEVSGVLIAVAMCCLGSSLAGAREPIWTCAYPGYSENREPVIVTFVQQGDTLQVSPHTPGWERVEKYVILQDNDVGLVAATSFSYFAGKDAAAPGLNLGAFVILIDKQTMRFRRGNVLMGDADSAATYGTCKRD
jgi:hypothetical protein